MKTGSKKSTITIITLACLLAVAVASTVILAAFNAVRTSTTTITFADGLTMTLTPLDSTADIHITDANPGENAGTFTYSATGSGSSYETPVTLDGINAELTREAWVAYQINLTVETTAQTPVAVAGSWAYTANADVATFTPTTATGNAWQATLTIDHTVWDVSVSGNTVTVKSKAQIAEVSGTVEEDLFASIVIDGTTPGVVNDLAGKEFTAVFTIKAETSDDSVVTNPITFA